MNKSLTPIYDLYEAYKLCKKEVFFPGHKPIMSREDLSLIMQKAYFDGMLASNTCSPSSVKRETVEEIVDHYLDALEWAKLLQDGKRKGWYLDQFIPPDMRL